VPARNERTRREKIVHYQLSRQSSQVAVKCSLMAHGWWTNGSRVGSFSWSLPVFHVPPFANPHQFRARANKQNIFDTKLHPDAVRVLR
jgi:hypothetical protein